MRISVREMKLEEVDLVTGYFHGAAPEHLELLGVDPCRLPGKSDWKQLYELDYAQPREGRRSLLVIWELEGKPLGFSTVDKIVYGKEAYMHLHVLDPQNRRSGYGAACVRKSAEMYFKLLKLERLLCEPNGGCLNFCVRGAERLVHGGGRRLRRTTDAVGKSVSF